MRREGADVRAGLVGRIYFERDCDVRRVGAEGLFRVKVNRLRDFPDVGEFAVDTVLHKHRAVQGNRRLSKFNLPFGAYGRDALGQRLESRLFGLFRRNTKTPHELSLTALHVQTNNRRAVFGQIYSQKIPSLHFKSAPYCV